MDYSVTRLSNNMALEAVNCRMTGSEMEKKEFDKPAAFHECVCARCLATTSEGYLRIFGVFRPYKTPGILNFGPS